jgi:hypothetical protein
MEFDSSFQEILLKLAGCGRMDQRKKVELFRSFAHDLNVKTKGVWRAFEASNGIDWAFIGPSGQVLVIKESGDIIRYIDLEIRKKFSASEMKEIPFGWNPLS